MVNIGLLDSIVHIEQPNSIVYIEQPDSILYIKQHDSIMYIEQPDSILYIKQSDSIVNNEQLTHRVQPCMLENMKKKKYDQLDFFEVHNHLVQIYKDWACAKKGSKGRKDEGDGDDEKTKDKLKEGEMTTLLSWFSIVLKPICQKTP